MTTPKIKINENKNLSHLSSTRHNWEQWRLRNLPLRLFYILEEIGLLQTDADGNQYLGYFFFRGANRDKLQTTNLLGYIAEAIIARECTLSKGENAKWANIARKYIPSKCPLLKAMRSVYEPFTIPNADEYSPVITGSNLTKDDYNDLYDRTSPRDLCWIKFGDNKDKFEQMKALNNNYDKLVCSISNSDRCKELKVRKKRLEEEDKSILLYSGLQVKVSSGTYGRYVYDYFLNQNFYRLFPIVYFDLGNDFSKARNNIINASYCDDNSIFGKNHLSDDSFLHQSREKTLNHMLYRGRDINSRLHDELLYYGFLLEEMFQIPIECENSEHALQMRINHLKDENFVAKIAEYYWHERT